MPYLNLSVMPRLDTDKPDCLPWVVGYIIQMFSDREHAIHQTGRAVSSSLNSISTPRVEFKHSLYSILVLSTQKTEKHPQIPKVLGLYEPEDGRMAALIFVSGVILDLNSRTIALDAAVVLSTKNGLASSQFDTICDQLDSVTVEAIPVSKQELLVWHSALPAFVERCRTWPHNPERCEYSQG